jgi:cytochrome d ubiquinol oxidase subunit I
VIPWAIGLIGTRSISKEIRGIRHESLYGSLASFVGFYTVWLVVEAYLMQKFATQGPGSLGTGRYQFEPAHA